MEKYRLTNTEHSLIEKSRIPQAVYQFVDKRVVTLALSEGFLDLFGYSDREQAYYDMDHDMYKDVHPDDAARIADAAYRFATEGGTYETVYRSRTKYGSEYNIIHAMGEHVYTETGVRLAYVWYTYEGAFTEKTAQSMTLSSSLKNALYEESFLKASYYDHLTGLPAMTYFFELAMIRKEAIERDGGKAVMIYTDFGGMKYFNHKHGFAEGDRLLQAFARVLASTFGNENCSRLGQDHFGIITQEAGLNETLEKLFAECQSLNNGLTLSLHVGVYCFRMENVGSSMACDRAKLACDALQNRYASCYSYYNANMRDAEDKQQYILANLDKAIAERWITVYYQPIVRAVSGRVCDEEALARWIDPVRGFMSPADFIPTLEDARLIYKLDLYIVDRVLEKMKIMQDAGHPVIPQSVNLSRSDFDTCDIVEEIRKRVDASGFPRKMLTIEITESIIGSNFEFMTEQIRRFRDLGFEVWMDDFGSGYSSLDVLQSIKFDLIKFDMRFMQQFNEGDAGKIILTQLLKMATSLGIDTICEGVETEEQMQFLQETGCSKLQGYYFDKPIPVEKILEKYEKGKQIGFEDPADLQYFQTIGKVNLHDLTIIHEGNTEGFFNFFNTLPMAILEFRGDQVRLARSNSSYRALLEQHQLIKYPDINGSCLPWEPIGIFTFMQMLKRSAETGERLFFDNTLPNGSTSHCCSRRIAVNKHTQTTAVSVVILSVTSSEQRMTYANIAKALAADYFNIYYIDLETEKFIEYSSDVSADELAVERHGEDFFRASRRDALEYLYQDDREAFIAAFTKEHVLQELDEQGTFTLTYRLLIAGKPVYVHMKAQRMPQDPKHIIVGVSNVDSQMKQQMMLDKIRQDQKVYSRMIALSGEYICIYVIDPETENYVEYSAADVYKGLGLAKSGTEFFKRAHELSKDHVLPEDQTHFCEMLTKENVMCDIEKTGLFRLHYRILLDNLPKSVNARAALVEEDDGKKLILGISFVETDAT